MATSSKSFADALLLAANGQKIEAVLIGKRQWYEDQDTIPDDKVNRLLSWSEAKSLLNYPYSSGFGLPDCNPVYLWTTTDIIFVAQYDGSTTIHSISRNPCAGVPEMPGGS